jgi:ribosomal protein S18 acetylase RimI-like enzyme
MEIRCMTIEDYDGVFALWSNTAGMGLHGFEDSREGIEKFLKRNTGCSFVAVEGDNIIGAVLGGHDGRKGYIYHAAVDTAYRGRGIGRRLLESVKQSFQNEGITKLGLLVFKSNDIGNAFWRSDGWSEREDLNYYSLYLDE